MCNYLELNIANNKTRAWFIKNITIFTSTQTSQFSESKSFKFIGTKLGLYKIFPLFRRQKRKKMQASPVQNEIILYVQLCFHDEYLELNTLDKDKDKFKKKYPIIMYFFPPGSLS